MLFPFPSNANEFVWDEDKGPDEDDEHGPSEERREGKNRRPDEEMPPTSSSSFLILISLKSSCKDPPRQRFENDFFQLFSSSPGIKECEFKHKKNIEWIFENN